MNLGELIVELSADSSDLEKTLERAKKKPMKQLCQ